MKVILLLFIVVIPPMAHANHWAPRPSSYSTLDTAMWFSSSDFRLSSNDRVISVSVDRVGISLYEISPDNIKYGANIGYVYLSDTDQADTKGIDLVGNYLSVGVEYNALDKPRIELNVGINYLYQQVRGESLTQTAKQRWTELTGRINAHIKMIDLLAMDLTWTLGKLAMHQQAAGSVDNNIDFEGDTAHKASVGFDISTGNKGWVGIFFTRGYEQGVHLKFQRLY